MTRKEQLGVEASEEPAPTSTSNRGRGKGRGRGRGRGKKQTVEMEDDKTDKQQEDAEEVDDQDAGQEVETPGDHVDHTRDEGMADNKGKPNQKNVKAKAKAVPKGKKAKDDGQKAAKPKATPKKTMKKPAARKQKKEEADMENGDEKEIKRKAPGADGEEPAGEGKKARTWGGRWIPLEDGVALRKMKAVMQVWEMALQNKFKSQSSLQSPFFKMCTSAFRAAEIDCDETPLEKFIEVAEHQVVPFTKDETFSNWDW